MAVGINERLDIIQAVRIAAAREEGSKRRQRRFMPEQPCCGTMLTDSNHCKLNCSPGKQALAKKCQIANS